MSNRDSGRDPRWRGRGGQGAGPSQPPPVVDEEEDVVTPDRIPSQTVQPQSAVPTHGYEPWFNFPYFDSSQVPSQQSNANTPQPNVGDIPSTSWQNLMFWHTYGRYMPYNYNFVLSLFGNAQQSTATHPPQHPTQNVDQPQPSQPVSHASQGPAETGQPLLSGQAQTYSTTKVFIEPEWDT